MAMKRYAVLYAPNFRLQASLRHSPHLTGEPFALVEVATGGKARVSEVNPPALECRVEIGMTPTQAAARCPDIRLLSGDAGHERSAQAILLQYAEEISPFVEVTGPGVVTVELPSGRETGEGELKARLIQPLCSLGLDIRVGVAGTPFLALLASRVARPVRAVEDPATFLAPLPVEALQLSVELASTLRTWGIKTIGELRALPVRETCERLGPEAVAVWERATGGQPRPLDLVKPVESFSEASDLEQGIETLEPLLFLLRRFLEQIIARLQATYLVAGKLRLGLKFENGSPYHRVFTIPQPTRNVDLLFRMLHTHLENFTSEAPIVSVELSARPIRPTAEQYDLLERGLKDPHQLAETLARLDALLGTKRVGTPELEPSRHPDAFHLRPYDANAPSLPESEMPPLGVPWLRFRPVIEARVVLHDEEPTYLYSTLITGNIRERRGPWRIASDWWGQRGWSREEWDIETEDGLYRLVRVGSEWFLDGIYF
jgi:protein ImuB